jgi:hypothetical protein
MADATALMTKDTADRSISYRWQVNTASINSIHAILEFGEEQLQGLWFNSHIFQVNVRLTFIYLSYHLCRLLATSWRLRSLLSGRHPSHQLQRPHRRQKPLLAGLQQLRQTRNMAAIVNRVSNTAIHDVCE